MAISKSKAALQAASNTSTVQRIHSIHIWLTALYALQGIVILLLSTSKLFPVQVSHLAVNPLATETAGQTVLATATHQLFTVNLAYVIAAAFFVAAIMHGLAATAYRKPYEAMVKKGTNPLRWIAFGLISGLLIVATAMLSGVVDSMTLAALFMFALIMALGKMTMELSLQSTKGKLSWLPYIIGCIAGVVPWVVLAVYAWAAQVYGEGALQGFVYGLYATLIVFFVLTIAIQYKTYGKTGRWQDYLYGEQAHMALAFVTMTAFAWQVYAGVLRP